MEKYLKAINNLPEEFTGTLDEREKLIVDKVFDALSLTALSRDLGISTTRSGVLFKRAILKIGTEVCQQDKKEDYPALWELSEYVFYQAAKNDSLFNAVKPYYQAYSKASGKKAPPSKYEIVNL